MGQEINRTRFSEADFQQFAARLTDETAALRSFAKAGGFTDARYVAGFELEAWLLDHAGRPSPVNDAYLRALNDPLVVPELSRFNVELNAPPVEMGAGVLAAMEESLLTTWDTCQQVAHGMDTVLAMIGILPTIRDEDLCLANMSAMNRFDVLNAQVLQQRDGAPIRIDIEGTDQLHLSRPDVMLEAATTSFQLHLQVPFAQAGRYYNASLISCAPLLAAAVNSPLLFGQRLWQETRVPLFEQSVEFGGYNGLAEPTVRRVTFGRDYVASSPLELFEENLEHYPVLLPMPQTEPPTRFPHLRLHNGAIWRWVRPLIGFDAAGQAHVRLEQRVLPSGPTVLDMVANAALYFGLVHALARQPHAVEVRFSLCRRTRQFLCRRPPWTAGRTDLAGWPALFGARSSSRSGVAAGAPGAARFRAAGCRDRALPGRRRSPGTQRPDRVGMATAAARTAGGRRPPHDGRLSGQPAFRRAGARVESVMLTQYDALPPGLLDLPAARLGEVLPGPALIHLPGRRTPPLFVSVLLHGNEDTGWLAAQSVLKKYATAELPRALSLFIGNVEAARSGLRRLDGQPDYNRVWPGSEEAHPAELAMMRQVVDVMRARGVFASIDIHNNTGLNPHYACVNRLDQALSASRHAVFAHRGLFHPAARRSVGRFRRTVPGGHGGMRQAGNARQRRACRRVHGGLPASVRIPRAPGGAA